ncbi:MAG TPA: MaoC family dehydratase [Gaiellaceae bacterium]|jgi:acyl dehydratase
MTAIEEGAEFGPSSWIDVPQEMIQAFADATHDHNFIHVDPEMAKQSPFGGTIAHGYLTLSLLPAMSYEVLPHDDPGIGMGLNYGLNKVRFPAPVPSGSRVRGTFRVDELKQEDWGRQSTMTATIECEGVEKPVCVAEVIYRYYKL